MDCLAQIVEAVRSTVLAARSPGAIGRNLVAMTRCLTDHGYQEFMASFSKHDAYFTNFNIRGALVYLLPSAPLTRLQSCTSF